MYPFSRLSSKYSLRTFCSFGKRGYTLLLIMFGVFSVNLILWSQGQWGGSWWASCSKNTFQCHLKAVGTVSSMLTLVALLVINRGFETCGISVMGFQGYGLGSVWPNLCHTPCILWPATFLNSQLLMSHCKANPPSITDNYHQSFYIIL